MNPLAMLGSGRSTEVAKNPTSVLSQVASVSVPNKLN